MSEIAVSEARELVIRPTGQIVNLDHPAEVVEALDGIRQMKRVLDEARAVLEEALIEEAARVGSKTLRYGKLTASIADKSEIEWDVTELAKLLDLGLPPDRYGELVHEQISYKVDGSVARQLAGANPEYAKLIEAAKGRKPGRSYVSVKMG